MGLYQQSHEHVPPEISATGRIEVLPVQWRKQLNLEVKRHPGISVLYMLMGLSCIDLEGFEGFCMLLSGQELEDSFSEDLNAAFRGRKGKH